MLIRRHFRIKGLQFIYAQHLSKINVNKVEKNMLKSMKDLYNLYLFLLCMILYIEKHFSKKELLNTLNDQQKRFLKNIFQNPIVKILSSNKYLIKKYNSNYKNNWKYNKNIIHFLILEIKKIKKYKEKIKKSFEEEKNFILKFYEDYFIFNKKMEKLYLDISLENLSIAHDMVFKTLKSINYYNPRDFKLNNINKNVENKKFIIELYRKTISHKLEFNKLIKNISKNWDLNRIGTIDLIILQMATCEFLYFPNIPPKVTMNEYIEITKIFCMEKSKNFINGIMDKIFKTIKYN